MTTNKPIDLSAGPLQHEPFLYNGARFEYDDTDGGHPVHVTVIADNIRLQQFTSEATPRWTYVDLSVRLEYPDIPARVMEYPTSIWGLLYMLKKHQAVQIMDYNGNKYNVKLYTDRA